MSISLGITTPEEVALFLGKSQSWVYKHWRELGGRKLGGSLFFPRTEDLAERIFGQGKGVEIRLHPEGNQAHGSLVRNEETSNKGHDKGQRGGAKPDKARDEIYGTDPKRHGF